MSAPVSVSSWRHTAEGPQKKQKGSHTMGKPLGNPETLLTIAQQVRDFKSVYGEDVNAWARFFVDLENSEGVDEFSKSNKAITANTIRFLMSVLPNDDTVSVDRIWVKEFTYVVCTPVMYPDSKTRKTGIVYLSGYMGSLGLGRCDDNNRFLHSRDTHDQICKLWALLYNDGKDIYKCPWLIIVA